MFFGVPRCFQWNTARTKTPLWVCCDLRQKCCDLCCDLDLKKHSVLPILLRRCDLPGGSPPNLRRIALRRRIPSGLPPNLNTKIDLKYLPIQALAFATPQNLNTSP